MAAGEGQGAARRHEESVWPTVTAEKALCAFGTRPTDAFDYMRDDRRIDD